MKDSLNLAPKNKLAYDYVKFNREKLKESYGARLPSEIKLAGLIGVDRFAVRRALKQLVEEGVLHSVRNRGYYLEFLQNNVVVSSETSYHKFCEHQSYVPKVQILEITCEYACPTVAKELETPPEAQVWDVLFLRYRENVPFCLTRSWILCNRTPGLISKLISPNPSLHGLFRQHYGFLPKRKKTVCAALNAGRQEAQWLALPQSFALLKASSLVEDQYGRPLEYCETLYRSDMISLVFDLEGNEV